jgi:LysR family nitrogen assimilation transcriptional regulator
MSDEALAVRDTLSQLVSELVASQRLVGVSAPDVAGALAA